MALVALSGCGGSETARLRAAFPELDPEFARKLVESDDSTLVRFCRRAGWTRTYAALTTLAKRDSLSLDAFSRLEEIARQPSVRLYTALGPAFGLHRQSRDGVARIRAPFEVRYRWWRVRREMSAVQGDRGLSFHDRIRRIEQLMMGCEEPDGRIRLDGLIALAYLELRSGGNRDFHHLRRAVATAREMETQPLLCQLLGTLGVALARGPTPDSALILWGEGVELARRHAITAQEARLLGFTGDFFANRGRWTPASWFFEEAIRVGREKGEDGETLRPRLEYLERMADLGLWEFVGRGLRTIGTELRGAERARSPSSPRLTARVQLLKARCAAAFGEFEAAERLFESAAVELGSPHPHELADPAWVKHAVYRAAAWLGRGRPEEAIRWARAGLDYCRAWSVPEHRPDLVLLLARGEYAQGNLDSSRAALRAFRELAPEAGGHTIEQRLESSALAARLAARTGDPKELQRAVRVGLGRFEGDLAVLERRPENYRFIEGRNPLRHALRDLLAEQPDLGREFETYWRGLRGVLGTERPADLSKDAARLVSTISPRQSGGVVRQAVRDGPDGTSARRIRLLYGVADTVRRWTIAGGRSLVETVAVPRDRLEWLVSRATDGFAAAALDPVASLDGAASDALRELSEALLPVEILEGRTPATRLEIEAEGFLSRLPFEALPIVSREAWPLLHDYDVVYVRSSRPRARSRHGEGTLILSRPALSSRVTRRFGGIPELRFAEREVAALQRLDPAVVHLSGEAAAKRNLTRRWSSMEVLFFATHAYEDPKAPFARCIPLAAGDGSLPEDDALELSDVLAADLTRCRLVVLSGCATGAPSSWSSDLGPSLAEAFLDAGAGAVIHTAWPVRDDLAAVQMTDFIGRWKGTGLSPEAALTLTRRELLRQQGPGGNPGVWAAYRLTVRDPR
jgi:hypothetical protein